MTQAASTRRTVMVLGVFAALGIAPAFFMDLNKARQTDPVGTGFGELVSVFLIVLEAVLICLWRRHQSRGLRLLEAGHVVMGKVASINRVVYRQSGDVVDEQLRAEIHYADLDGILRSYHCKWEINPSRVAWFREGATVALLVDPSNGENVVAYSLDFSGIDSGLLAATG